MWVQVQVVRQAHGRAAVVHVVSLFTKISTKDFVDSYCYSYSCNEDDIMLLYSLKDSRVCMQFDAVFKCSEQRVPRSKMADVEI